MLDSETKDDLDAEAQERAAQEAELAQRIEAGDTLAEEQLFRRYSKGLRLMLIARSKCPAKSDDACQEAFSICIQRIRNGELRDHARLKSFLYSTASNVLRDIHRREDRFATWNPELDTRTEDEAASKIIFDKQRNMLIARLIQELPTERDRDVLTKFYLEETERDELCKQLNIDSVHFSRVIFRAKQRLKVLLEKKNLTNHYSD